MLVTSNFTKKNKSYGEVAPHNHRIKSKTKNQNINWNYTRDDILNQHPVDFNKVEYKFFGTYALKHDLKRLKSGHASETYGSTKSPVKIKRSLRYIAENHNRTDDLVTRSAVRRLIAKRRPYRTFTLGFANGESRADYWKAIKSAYPGISLHKILRSEANGVNRIPKILNSNLSNIDFTDYDVHVDEIKKYVQTVKHYDRLKMSDPKKAKMFYADNFTGDSPIKPGQAHCQGRFTFHSYTRSGKPSVNLNKAINISLKPHKRLIEKLAKKYPNPDKSRVVGFHNSQERFRAFNLYLTYITYKSVSAQLQRDFPKADLQFNFYRSGDKSYSHDSYQMLQDAKRKAHKYSNNVRRSLKREKKNTRKALKAHARKINEELDKRRNIFNSAVKSIGANLISESDEMDSGAKATVSTVAMGLSPSASRSANSVLSEQISSDSGNAPSYAQSLMDREVSRLISQRFQEQQKRKLIKNRNINTLQNLNSYIFSGSDLKQELLRSRNVASAEYAGAADSPFTKKPDKRSGADLLVERTGQALSVGAARGSFSVAYSLANSLASGYDGPEM